MFLPNIKVFAFASRSDIDTWGYELAHVSPKLRCLILDQTAKDRERILKHISLELQKIDKR